VAHATGIGFVGPQGLKMNNFKTHASGCDWRCFSIPTRIVTEGLLLLVSGTRNRPQFFGLQIFRSRLDLHSRQQLAAIDRKVAC
jgi:hypothetical protein